MIKITSPHGFHMVFENGWTASVQFGPGNYCDNYRISFTDTNFKQSYNAEVACWSKDGELVDILDSGDVITGHLTADEVLAFLNKVAAQPASL